MLKADAIRGLIERELTERGFFLVDIQIKPSGKIVVYADTLAGITLDECVTISSMMEKKMDRNAEDFELEVSSPGLDNPLRLPVQYKKNTGRMLRVITLDGDIKEGKITEADNEKVSLEITMKKKQPGKKKELQVELIEVQYTDIKSAKLIIR